MVEREVYRYVDRRGDTIIFKFDPDLMEGASADNNPLAVYHVWYHRTRTMEQWSSTLLDRTEAAQRWFREKRPVTGLVLWHGERAGKEIDVRFVGYDINPKGWVIIEERKKAKKGVKGVKGMKR